MNLDVKQDGTVNNGNILGLSSTFETADGATHAAADVWFATTPTSNLSGNVSGLAQALSSFAGSNAATPAAAKLEVPGAVGNNVAQLAGAIQQYSEQSLGAPGQAATDSELRLKALQSQGGHGFLAAPAK